MKCWITLIWKCSLVVLEVFEVDNKSDFNVLVGYDYEKHCG